MEPSSGRMGSRLKAAMLMLKKPKMARAVFSGAKGVNPNFVSKLSVARPIQDSRELVVAHPAESSPTALNGKPLSYWVSTNSCSEPKKGSPGRRALKSTLPLGCQKLTSSSGPSVER